ncbi:pLS20_p028 family conjugation system transmembrane protein [Staphylococcus aureus]|uniref:pLS20_p028 family conjugation system transmembrane protein n=1 Tax=Staphylococcus aureus TaxID=1280 RepID=UPI00215CB67F|nr:hypothetical protein [Staphylococcus aureus]UVI86662.1 hypothetical protein NW951_08860 [Staphylococcus aureus]UVJ27817.1 hypothetical protein NW963_08845 [Staphylococcus aureus]
MINSFFVIGVVKSQDREAIRILKDNQDLFHSNGSWDFLIHFFVDIGWFLTGWLYRFVNFVEDILDKIVTFGGLMNSQEVTNLSMKMMPIAFTLMALVIAILGFSIMMGIKIPISKLVINIILASLFIVSLPGIFQQAFDLNQGLYKDIKSSEFTGKNDLNMNHNKNLKRLSSQIMANNITDLVWFANHHYKRASNDINNEFVDDSFTNGYRRWTEKIKPDKKDPNNKEGFRYYKSISDSDINKAVFNNSIVQADSDDDDAYNGFVLKPLSEGIGKSFLSNTTEAFSGYYQRYQANFFAIWFELGVLAFVYVLTAFKIARLGYEVTAQKIVAPWIAATDIATLQKIKQLMINLFTNYGLIALIVILLKVFVILSNTTFKSDIPLSVKLIIFLALAIGTIDGPEEIKKLLGVDAGIRDGYKTAMAGTAVMAVAGKTGSKMVHATGSGIKSLQNLFSSTKRAENARSSAKSVADEIHDKFMLDDEASYNKREKDRGDKSFINPDINQDKYNDGNRNENSNALNNQFENKETDRNASHNDGNDIDNNELIDSTNHTHEIDRGNENYSDEKENDSYFNNEVPEQVSVDVANKDNKYDNHTVNESNEDDFHIDGDLNEIRGESELISHQDLGSSNGANIDSVDNNLNKNPNILEKDENKKYNELDGMNNKYTPIGNYNEIKDKQPLNISSGHEKSEISNNGSIDNQDNTITNNNPDSNSNAHEKEFKGNSHLTNVESITKEDSNLNKQENKSTNDSLKSFDFESNLFESVKTNGHAQKYRSKKSINKSWLDYKINKSNQGGKQN